MLAEVLSVVDLGFEYWIRKNHVYGRYEEIFNERVWSWCLKVWKKYNPDYRYSLSFVLFRVEKGEGFKIHRDKGSGKMVILIMLDGFLNFVCDGVERRINCGEIVCFEGNKLHGVLKGSEGKYLVLFSGKL
jgi:hypothetical protein